MTGKKSLVITKDKKYFMSHMQNKSPKAWVHAVDKGNYVTYGTTEFHFADPSIPASMFKVKNEEWDELIVIASLSWLQLKLLCENMNFKGHERFRLAPGEKWVPGCKHEWKEYYGIRETYNYCAKCGIKEKK